MKKLLYSASYTIIAMYVTFREMFVSLDFNMTNNSLKDFYFPMLMAFELFVFDMVFRHVEENIIIKKQLVCLSFFMFLFALSMAYNHCQCFMMSYFIVSWFLLFLMKYFSYGECVIDKQQNNSPTFNGEQG